MIKYLLYFAAAGLCEIGGGYLVWLWIRENKPIYYAVIGAAVLVLYGVIPTRNQRALDACTRPMAACLLFSLSCGVGGLIRSPLIGLI